ncbi:MAG: segregation/condensation protein A [Polyangiaceae bacterium]|nr:segregation/condensation protein A [Polyangiaceae bacterium]
MTEPAPNQDAVLSVTVRDDACRVELPQFEGPLDLLLHLIQKHELDILDIPISFITERYLAYLNLMEKLSLDIASEYLVMAATLAHIKSKLLLPTPPADQEDGLEDEPEDPRAELVRRLLEYQKYKHAAAELTERSRLGADVFERGLIETQPQGPAPLAPAGIFALIDAFNGILERRRIRVEHEVDLDRISITQRINEIVDALKIRARLTLEELVPESVSRAEVIITFLAMLEMTRLKLTRLYQSGHLSPLYIELALIDEAEQKPSDGAPSAAAT